MDYDLSPRESAWRDEVRAFIAEHVDESLSRETREVGNEGRGPRARRFLDAKAAWFAAHLSTNADHGPPDTE